MWEAKDFGTSPLAIQDLLTKDDKTLARFMTIFYHFDGRFGIPVTEGWGRLTDQERTRFEGILETVKNMMPLEDVKPPHPGAEDQEAREAVRYSHRSAYRRLCNDGGRPLFALDELKTIDAKFQRKDEDDFLGPWLRLAYQARDDRLQVSGIWKGQNYQWERFREWQRNNRGLVEDEETAFESFLDAERRGVISRADNLERLLEITSDSEKYQREWKYKKERDQHMARSRWQPDCNNFQDYGEAVRQRLSRHGFTQPIDLREDPKQQDQLSTWIEYLNFEYWHLDLYNSFMDPHQPAYDAALRQLREADALKHHQTLEWLRTSEGQTEFDRLERAVTSTSARCSFEVPEHWLEGKDEDSRRWYVERNRVWRIKYPLRTDEDQKRHDEEKAKLLRAVKEIDPFVRVAKYYFYHRDLAADVEKRLPWVLQQIPLIEAEMSMTGDDQHETAPQSKRGRAEDGGEEQIPPAAKKRKRDPTGTGRGTMSSGRLTGAAAAIDPADVTKNADAGAEQHEQHDGDEAPKAGTKKPPSGRRKLRKEPVGSSSQPTADLPVRRSSRITALRGQAKPDVVEEIAPAQESRPSDKKEKEKMAATPRRGRK